MPPPDDNSALVSQARTQIDNIKIALGRLKHEYNYDPQTWQPISQQVDQFTNEQTAKLDEMRQSLADGADPTIINQQSQHIGDATSHLSNRVMILKPEIDQAVAAGRVEDVNSLKYTLDSHAGAINQTLKDNLSRIAASPGSAGAPDPSPPTAAQAKDDPAASKPSSRTIISESELKPEAASPSRTVIEPDPITIKPDPIKINPEPAQAEPFAPKSAVVEGAPMVDMGNGNKLFNVPDEPHVVSAKVNLYGPGGGAPIDSIGEVKVLVAHGQPDTNGDWVFKNGQKVTDVIKQYNFDHPDAPIKAAAVCSPTGVTAEIDAPGVIHAANTNVGVSGFNDDGKLTLDIRLQSPQGSFVMPEGNTLSQPSVPPVGRDDFSVGAGPSGERSAHPMTLDRETGTSWSQPRDATKTTVVADSSKAGSFVENRFPVGSAVYYPDGKTGLIKGEVVGHSQDASGADMVEVKPAGAGRFALPESEKASRLLNFEENAPEYKPGDVVRFKDKSGGLKADEWQVESIQDGKLKLTTTNDAGIVYTNEMDIKDASRAVTKISAGGAADLGQAAGGASAWDIKQALIDKMARARSAAKATASEGTGPAPATETAPSGVRPGKLVADKPDEIIKSKGSVIADDSPGVDQPNRINLSTAEVKSSGPTGIRSVITDDSPGVDQPSSINLTGASSGGLSTEHNLAVEVEKPVAAVEETAAKAARTMPNLFGGTGHPLLDNWQDTGLTLNGTPAGKTAAINGSDAAQAMSEVSGEDTEVKKDSLNTIKKLSRALRRDPKPAGDTEPVGEDASVTADTAGVDTKVAKVTGAAEKAAAKASRRPPSLFGSTGHPLLDNWQDDGPPLAETSAAKRTVNTERTVKASAGTAMEDNSKSVVNDSAKNKLKTGKKTIISDDSPGVDQPSRINLNSAKNIKRPDVKGGLITDDSPGVDQPNRMNITGKNKPATSRGSLADGAVAADAEESAKVLGTLGKVANAVKVGSKVIGKAGEAGMVAYAGYEVGKTAYETDKKTVSDVAQGKYKNLPKDALAETIMPAVAAKNVANAMIIEPAHQALTAEAAGNQKSVELGGLNVVSAGDSYSPEKFKKALSLQTGPGWMAGKNGRTFSRKIYNSKGQVSGVQKISTDTLQIAQTGSGSPYKDPARQKEVAADNKLNHQLFTPSAPGGMAAVNNPANLLKPKVIKHAAVTHVRAKVHTPSTAPTTHKDQLAEVDAKVAHGKALTEHNVPKTVVVAVPHTVTTYTTVTDQRAITPDSAHDDLMAKVRHSEAMSAPQTHVEKKTTTYYTYETETVGGSSGYTAAPPPPPPPPKVKYRVAPNGDLQEMNETAGGNWYTVKKADPGQQFVIGDGGDSYSTAAGNPLPGWLSGRPGIYSTPLTVADTNMVSEHGAGQSAPAENVYSSASFKSPVVDTSDFGRPSQADAERNIGRADSDLAGIPAEPTPAEADPTASSYSSARPTDWAGHQAISRADPDLASPAARPAASQSSTSGGSTGTAADIIDLKNGFTSGGAKAVAPPASEPISEHGMGQSAPAENVYGTASFNSSSPAPDSSSFGKPSESAALRTIARADPDLAGAVPAVNSSVISANDTASAGAPNDPAPPAASVTTTTDATDLKSGLNEVHQLSQNLPSTTAASYVPPAPEPISEHGMGQSAPAENVYGSASFKSPVVDTSNISRAEGHIAPPITLPVPTANDTYNTGLGSVADTTSGNIHHPGAFL